MHRYLIVIEPTETGFSSYAPDLPGCIATGRTKPDVTQAMQEAIAFHVEGLRAEGLPVPAAETSASFVEIAA